jgi:hypothetical protein
MENVININAIAYKEGDAWIAQGIEYDIVAQASDVISLPDAFTRAVLENICITEHLGRKPLEGIKSAPSRFHEMFESAKVEVRATNQHGTTEVAVRVAA